MKRLINKAAGAYIFLLGVVIFFLSGPVYGDYNFNTGNTVGGLVAIAGVVLFLIYLIPRIKL